MSITLPADDDEFPDQSNPFLLPAEPDSGRLTKMVGNAEAWLAAFSGTILSVLYIVLFLAATELINAPGISDTLFVLLVFAGAAVFQGPFLFRLWAATLLAERPVGPAVARRTQTRLSGIRWLAALWWLMHIVVAMAIVVGGEVQVIRNANRPGIAVLAMLLFGMSICSNVFVALFVKAVWNSDAAVDRFWKWRLVIDISLTAAALMIASGM